MEPVPLTSDHLSMFLTSLGIHITYFFLIKKFVPFIGKDRRKLSWVLTIVTSLVVSIMGPYATFGNLRTVWSEPVPYEMYAISSNHIVSEGSRQYSRYDIKFNNLNNIQEQRTPSWSRFDDVKSEDIPMIDDTKSILELYKEYDSKYTTSASLKQSLSHSRWVFDLRFTDTDNRASQATTIFFSCYLIMDIVCGMLYYREQVSILAGWFHHTMYIAFCYYGITYRGSQAFAIFLVIEVPTFILGLGFLHKPLRNDLLFATSFFLFRIVFDFALSHEFIMNRTDLSIIGKSIIAFKSLMNFKFFIDLIHQQIKLRRRRVSPLSTVPEKIIHPIGAKTEPRTTLHSNLATPIVSITKNSKRITTLVHQSQQQQVGYHRPQHNQGKPQSSRKARRKSNSNILEESHSGSSSALKTTSISKSIIKSRSSRHGAGSMLDDQPIVDMITAH